MRRSPQRARLLALVVLLPLAALAALPAGAGADGAPPAGAAAGGPGALSHFDLARKDCVGTARNRTSRCGSRSRTAC